MTEQKNLRKARTNITIWLAAMAGMMATTLFMWFTTGLSAGTYLATGLTALFLTLLLLTRNRVQRLEAKQLA